MLFGCWCLVGLGVWTGLVTTQFSTLKNYSVPQLLLGFVLTVLLWPVAVYTNFKD